MDIYLWNEHLVPPVVGKSSWKALLLWSIQNLIPYRIFCWMLNDTSFPAIISSWCMIFSGKLALIYLKLILFKSEQYQCCCFSFPPPLLPYTTPWPWNHLECTLTTHHVFHIWLIGQQSRINQPYVVTNEETLRIRHLGSNHCLLLSNGVWPLEKSLTAAESRSLTCHVREPNKRVRPCEF